MYKSIEHITDESDLFEFYTKLGIEMSSHIPYIIKFCRTRHLLNLGAATRDDLIMDIREQKDFFNKEIYIEEKIDGANIGFSIKDGKIVAQNRSHYVNSATQTQFKELDKWIMNHSAELYDILENGKYILFGEWLYAKHSIQYNKLPDYFIAFDLYEIACKKFVARPILEEKLKDTTINQIRLIAKTTITNINDIKQFIGDSIYYDGFAEGLYVRLCDSKHVLQRGKVVRPNFLTSETHWSKQIMIKNELISF
jgi:atypical dual specificity phosphatase